MKTLFQTELSGKNLEIYNNVIKSIKHTNQELIQELDQLILNYSILNRFEMLFYLDEKPVDEKIAYFAELREKLLKMNDCDKVKVKVATKWHPMCWAHNLLKFFPNNKFLENIRMFGFCVPFYPGRPIMLSQYVFDAGEAEVLDILAHELTHSLMYTRDLNADNAVDALDDAWTICLLY